MSLSRTSTTARKTPKIPVRTVMKIKPGGVVSGATFGAAGGIDGGRSGGWDGDGGGSGENKAPARFDAVSVAVSARFDAVFVAVFATFDAVFAILPIAFAPAFAIFERAFIVQSGPPSPDERYGLFLPAAPGKEMARARHR